MHTFGHVVAFVIGLLIVQAVLRSAIRTVVVPRDEQVMLSRVVFLAMRAVYAPMARRHRGIEEREAVLARYAPTTLILLAVTWVFLVFLGFVAIFWAVGDITVEDAILVSGSSITTLGFVAARSDPTAAVSFIEALIGLGLLALLISYLPTIYGHFSRRETQVVKLEGPAGTPPWSGTMIRRYNDIGWIDRLGYSWPDWQQWFVEVQESHTSQPALPLFRSLDAGSSWVTAAGTVLDAAAIQLAAIDIPDDAQAALMLRAGFLSLQSVAVFFNVPIAEDPAPNDPISIERGEFDALLDELAEAGVPLKSDREQAWRDFAGWRVNYDQALLALCRITLAPPARWSSDRTERYHPPTLRRLRRWEIEPLRTPPSW